MLIELLIKLDFQVIRFQADIAKDAARQWKMVTEMKKEAREGNVGSGRMVKANQQMTMEQVFKMVNSQKEQMWQQERKSKKLSNSTLCSTKKEVSQLELRRRKAIFQMSTER